MHWPKDTQQLGGGTAVRSDHGTPLQKPGCGVEFESRRHQNRPSFGHKQRHLCRAGLVACRSKLLSHTIVFWGFCKTLDYFRREITMEGYGTSRAGPPGTTRSPQSGARLCVARGLRKPTQPCARRMSSLLRYFLSIHCSHLGKGWITIQEKGYISCLFVYRCAAIAIFERVFASTCTGSLSAVAVC